MIPISLSSMPVLSSSKKVAAKEFGATSSTSTTTGAGTFSIARSDTSSHDVAIKRITIARTVASADLSIDNIFEVVIGFKSLVEVFYSLLNPPHGGFHIIWTAIERFCLCHVVCVQRVFC